MRQLLRVVWSVSMLGWAAWAHAQDPFTTPGAFVDYNLMAQRNTEVYVNTTEWVSATGATQAPSETVPGAVGIASFAAQGGIGRASLSLTASGDGFSPQVFTGWTDRLVVNAPGLTGTTGTLSFQLRYDWTAQTDANPGGQTSAAPYIDANFLVVGGANYAGQYAAVNQQLTQDCAAAACERTEIWFGDSLRTTRPTFADGVATFSFNFVYGQDYYLTIGLNGALQGTYGASSIDAPQGLFWNGVQSVTSQGQAVMDYTITSAVGLDYASAVTAVAEPQSYALLSVGLVLLALRRRGAR